jgi:hypothetical protein
LIAKRIRSQETILGSADRGLGSDAWTKLRIEVHGELLGIEVAADDQPLIFAQDTTNPSPPRVIGFRAVAGNSGTEIDDLLLRTPPDHGPATAEPDRQEVIPITVPGPE